MRMKPYWEYIIHNTCRGREYHTWGYGADEEQAKAIFRSCWPEAIITSIEATGRIIQAVL